MTTIHTNQLFLYGYLNDETRVIVYQIYYGDNPEDFAKALNKCRKIKSSRKDSFVRFEIVCLVTTSIRVE